MNSTPRVPFLLDTDLCRLHPHINPTCAYRAGPWIVYLRALHPHINSTCTFRAGHWPPQTTPNIDPIVLSCCNGHWLARSLALSIYLKEKKKKKASYAEVILTFSRRSQPLSRPLFPSLSGAERQYS
jgi:hypothetical protein